MTRTSLLIASQGVSVYPPTGLQSACRADFIVAQGNALGSEVIVGCALSYDDSAPLGRIVAILRLNRSV